MLTYARVQPADVPAITALYADHVLHGTATFEIDPPSVDTMHERVRSVESLGLPFYVARDDARIVGYAYTTAYRTRPAYRFTVEDSIYSTRAVTGAASGARC